MRVRMDVSALLFTVFLRGRVFGETEAQPGAFPVRPRGEPHGAGWRQGRPHRHLKRHTVLHCHKRQLPPKPKRPPKIRRWEKILESFSGALAET